MKRNILCRFVLSSVLLLTGCQKTPRAEARSELAELGLEFTQGAYRDAVDGGDAVVVGLFLAAGMSQNLVDSSGKTVLIRAAEEGQPAVAEKLLEAGARLETWDDEGLERADESKLERACRGSEIVAGCWGGRQFSEER